MESNNNKFIKVSYSLYDTTKEGDGNEVLIEKTADERPFIFVSGMGATIPSFEAEILKYNQGEEFDFELTPDQAYGEHFDERVIELDKQIFTINGQFDAQHVQVGAVLPLQNEDGNRFLGLVLAIGDDKVKIDLNHPLAGKKLNFCGEILESRDATAEEVAHMAKLMSGEGNGCGGNCGDCGNGGCKDGGCEGGNCEGGCDCNK